MSKNFKWSGEQIDIIKARRKLGVPVDVIRRELNRKYHLNLQFREVSAACAIVDRGGAIPTFLVVAEQPKEGKTGRQAVKRLKKDHVEAAVPTARSVEEESVEVAPESKIKPRHIRIEFKPVFVNTCVPGKIYIHAGIGAMECIGVSTQKIAGFDLELIKLREISDSATPANKQIQSAKFPKETIREPVSREIMECVLHKLEFGYSDIVDRPKRGKELAPFLESYLHTPSIDSITNLLCYVHGHSKVRDIPNITEINTGNSAMKILASECSVVMGVDYKQAMRLITDALRLTKREIDGPAPEAVPTRLFVNAPKTPGF